MDFEPHLYFLNSNSYEVFSYESRPVPCVSATVYAKLQEFSNYQGFVINLLEKADVSDPYKPQFRLGEIGYFESCRVIGELYATLTHSCSRQISSLDEASGLDVVLFLSDAVSSVELNDFCDSSSSKVTGLLCSIDVEGLYFAALKNYILMETGVTLNEATFFGHDIRRFYSVPGRQASLSDYSSEFLMVSGHSDGIDAKIDKTIVCSSNLQKNPLAGSPTCSVKGYCHRLDKGFDEIELGELLHPENFEAKMLIWDTCSAFLPNDSHVGFEYSILSELIDSSSVGVMISTFKIQFYDSLLFPMILSFLKRSELLGQLHSHISDYSERCEKGGQFILFGDPRISVKVGSFEERYSQNSSLKRCDVIIHKLSGEQLSSYVIAKGGIPVYEWSALSFAFKLRETKMCEYCNSQRCVYDFRFKKSYKDRILEICNVCGIVADFQKNAPCFSIVDGCDFYELKKKEGGSVNGVSVRAFVVHLNKKLNYDIMSSQLSFSAIKKAGFYGACRVSFVLTRGEEFSVYSRKHNCENLVC